MNSKTDKPNILLIVTDTQRCDTLKCMGADFAISPNIDRLAEQGVLFDQAHTSSPVCMPARCSLLTGVHTPIHGCIENGTTRRDGLNLLPDLLKEQGYHNIMVGKTHFGKIPESFDKVVASAEHKDYLRALGYDPKDANITYTTIPEEHALESFHVDKTIEAIEESVKTQNGPFFAFCSMIAPHPPEAPPGKWQTLYDDIELPEINYVEGEELDQPQHLVTSLGIAEKNQCFPYENKEDVGYWREAIGRIYEPQHRKTIDKMRRLYYGFAAYCDAMVGRLVDYLDRSGLRENTLVCFTSDHGQQYFDHGINDKHNYYDSSWRIPLILSMPGTLPQGERRDFAIWNDITTTFLGCAGTSCQTMQGFDLFTALKQGRPSPRRCAVATLYKSCALATKRWKIEYYFEEGSGRLFDRENDPLERTDLFNSPEHQSVKWQLLEALLCWRADIDDLKSLIDGTAPAGKPRKNDYMIVSPRLAIHTRAINGADAERRLGEKVEAI